MPEFGRREAFGRALAEEASLEYDIDDQIAAGLNRDSGEEDEIEHSLAHSQGAGPVFRDNMLLEDNMHEEPDLQHRNSILDGVDEPNVADGDLDAAEQFIRIDQELQLDQGHDRILGDAQNIPGNDEGANLIMRNRRYSSNQHRSHDLRAAESIHPPASSSAWLQRQIQENDPGQNDYGENEGAAAGSDKASIQKDQNQGGAAEGSATPTSNRVQIIDRAAAAHLDHLEEQLQNIPQRAQLARDSDEYGKEI